MSVAAIAARESANRVVAVNASLGVITWRPHA